MRILYALPAYKPAYRVGGPVLSVSAVAERLAARGHQVVVLTTNSNLNETLDVPTGRPIRIEGVEVWYFDTMEYAKRLLPFVSYVSKSLGFLYAPGMRAQLDRMVPEADIVHTHLPFIYPTYAAAHAAFRHGKPLFYHQRGLFDPARLRFRGVKKRLYIRAIERPILSRATGLFALTDAEVDSYRALGVQTPCHVVPNGIDVNAYRSQPAGLAAGHWSIPPDAQVVLFMGRLHPIKGADRLLEAFLRVAGRNQQAMLVMAGPDEWGLERSFRERARAAGLSDRVRFTGMVSGEEKVDLLARADLFCLPSDAEGFSMAVLEALASSTAVLLSEGCHFDSVEDAGAGMVVGLDPAEIGAALLRVLGDREALRAAGVAGRRLVQKDYDWDRIVDRFEAIYAGRASVESPAVRIDSVHR